MAVTFAGLTILHAADARPRAESRVAGAHEIRSLYTSEFGVARPNGVSWDHRRQSLVVTAPRAGGGSRVLRVTPGEHDLGLSPARHLKDATGAAFDPKSRRVTAPGIAGAVASTFAPGGTRYVLDAWGGITTVSPDGASERSTIKGLSGADLGAIAFHPGSRLRYVATADGSRVHAVDASGAVVRSHDLSSVGIDSLQGMTFAPSSDPTDQPGTQSLYVADSGDTTTLGRVAEVSLVEVQAAAPTASASLVATTDTSVWTPPSPDPSGVAFASGSGRLIVSDGEVDEMPIYAGVNLYAAQRSGAFIGGGTTVSWSNEPTGVAVNPDNGHLFVSDDDKKSIFEIASPGADGRFGTADDGARTTFKTSTFGNTDPEDVGFDSLRDDLLLVDGVGRELFRLDPGPNGVFNGVAPGGDDIATQFDLEVLGAIDPEGIAYDAARDTVVVVDGSSEKIYELDANGSLLNVIDISGLDSLKAAGITVAPASNGSGARHYYVVDRGLDNNSHPGENDGRLFELSASLPTITNRPPAANAGPDQLIDLPETATLTGTALDDGEPNNVLTYAWTKLSGPGVVTFGSAKAATTTATFSMVGQYVLRLTVSDGSLDDIDDVVVTVHNPGSSRTVQIPIASGADDAMEGGGSTGKFVDLASADVELGHNGGTARTPMLNGLRFTSLPVPRNGEIVSARIQFKVDETGTEATSYKIRGEASDSAPTYLAVAGNISARPSTTASVPWSPPAWNLIGEAGPAQQTPELKTIVQEVVNRPGWAEGNAVAFMIDGTGRRTAEAKDGLSPAVLLLEFRRQPPNTAPVVNAGLDSAIQLPANAALDGTVTDDGQPLGTPMTTTWSSAPGNPGAVTFENASLVDTTATFSAAGRYTLRLTANDGALSAFDEMVVDVERADAAPVVSAGPDQTVRIPAPASLQGVVDPGYPGPASLKWTKVDGPGSVTFADDTLAVTTAEFSVAGTYTLRLTATNKAQPPLSHHDDVVVTVEKPDLAIALGAPTATVLASAEVQLAGKVTRKVGGTPVADEEVEIWVTRAPGTTEEKLATVRSGSDGSFAFTDTPTVSSSYQARAGEDTSPTASVAVAPRLSSGLSLSAVAVGQHTRVRGSVAPAAAGQPVRLQRWNGSSWVTVATQTLAEGARVGYSFDIVLLKSARRTYRVAVPAYAGRVQALGSALRLDVYRADIVRVEPRADFVTVQNIGATAFDLAGWTLRNDSTGVTRTLPAFRVGAGRLVRIHSGSGVSDGNDLYLGRTTGMWGPHGVAVLRNNQGYRLDRFVY